MATGSDRDTKGPADDARRRKGRPATTIDLEAKEVKTSQPAPAMADTVPATSADEPVVTPAATPEPSDPPAASGEDATVSATPSAPAPGDATVVEERPADPVAAAADPAPAMADEAPAPRTEFKDTARSGPGRLSQLAAAAIGGLVVLAGGAGLFASGVLGPGEPPAAATPEQVSALEAKLADVTARLENTPASEPVNLGPLEQRLAALEQRPAPTGGEDVAGLRADLDALAARIGEAGSEAGPNLAPDLEAIRSAVTAVEQGLAETRSALDALPPAADPAELARLGETVGGMNGRLDELDRRIGTLAETVAATSGAIDELRGAVEDARSEAEASATALRDALAAVEGRVAAIEQRIDAGPKGGEIAALSLALTTLATKLDSGEPFAADLDLVRAGAGDADLSGLEAVAETGVPTVDALVASFPADAIAAARPVDPSAGVFDRVLTGAKSLVNYRETGDAATDPLSRPLAAAEEALAARDLRAARAAMTELPDWAKAVSATWTARLDARIAAEDAEAALTERLLARLQEPAEGR